MGLLRLLDITHAKAKDPINSEMRIVNATAHQSIGLLAILTYMNHLKTGTTTHMSRLSGRVNDGGPASRHCAYGPRRTKNID